MDRTILLQRLAQTERHAADGTRHVADQRKLIADLERNGRDTNFARDLLRQFESLRELHVADRDRLKKELKA